MRQRIPYLFFCGATVCLLVFLNAAQPFVLSHVFNLEQNGAASGMLALVDEVVSLILAPFWGALSDKVGTRYVAILGLWIMLASLYFYPRVNDIVPTLLVVRGLFALGASGAVAMITAGLAELSMLAPNAGGAQNSISDTAFLSQDPPVHDILGASSQTDTALDSVFSSCDSNNDGDETVPLFESTGIDNEVFGTLAAAPRPNGKLAGMVGLSSGIGAVFAVTVLLPLPTQLSIGEDGELLWGIRSAFRYISAIGAVLSLGLLVTMYQNPARGLRSFFLGSKNVSIFDEAALDAGGSVMSYLDLLKDGFLVARNDRRLVVAYMGSLIARSASVMLALFIPLWVNQWYYRTGRCSLPDAMIFDSSNKNCHEAIVRAAILTGLANTMVLLAAPFVGIAGDKFGSVLILGVSSLIGVVAMTLFVAISSPLGALPIVASCLLGIAQIGCTTMSMSMSTDKRRVSPGSVAGVYSLMGSLGILLITQIGGPMADRFSRSPFIVMGVIFATLLVACNQLSKRTALRSMRSSVSL